MRNGKSLILAYDQGLEHGPTDFDDNNVDPEYVINIARKGGYDAFACQKGIAESYYGNEKVPLLLKLNGKTRHIWEGTHSKTELFGEIRGKARSRGSRLHDLHRQRAREH